MIALAVVWLCLMVNALLSASEIAFVSLNRQVLQQLETRFPRRVRRLTRMRRSPERTLSVIQIGITMVGFLSGVVSGAGVEESAVPWMQETWGLEQGTAELIGIALVVLPLTALTVLFGELVPKALALRRPYRIALTASAMLWLLDRIFSPVVALFAGTTRRVVSLLDRIFLSGKASSSQDQTAQGEEIEKSHQRFLLNLAEFESRSIGEIFTPWDKAVFAERSQDLEEVLSLAIDTGHTRLPACRGNKVQGLIHTKELIAFASQGGRDWMLLLRPILRVRAFDSLMRALRLMQAKHSHMAIVEADDGSPLGFVTLEDLLETIVGDIQDEDDKPRFPRK